MSTAIVRFIGDNNTHNEGKFTYGKTYEAFLLSTGKT